jgi:adenylate cyclase
VTRFGLHIDEVMVGHFGAPDRMSFTALGDGVNLASRLEGLNKQYGTRMIVSDAVRRQAGAGFAFRRLDRVAVKGKARAVEIHELCDEVTPQMRVYEDAFAAYARRDFASAMGLLKAQCGADAPSAVLFTRCEALEARPPPAEWDGTFVAMEK